ncbi:MAG: 5'-methylthioadenosine/S-adenosylhomocysteine nucleosidase [Alphaproteobacteria bacterium]|nr:5'-methylthioadenosine/S-adenosylhomocysteine nucleosidase [Alphaproteobacteria bacterium]
MAYKLKIIGGRRLLYVVAARAEYGAHMASRFSPLFTGVGPVEAAVALGATLAELKANAALPDLVISLGSAGSNRLEQGKIYLVTHVSYRDMDASALGFEKGKVPFLDQPVDIEMTPQLAGVPGVRLSTGANVVSGSAYGRIDAGMVDMETYAHKRACQRFGVPLIGLRGISDGADKLASMKDWTRALAVIDERLAVVVDHLEAEIVAGRLP